MVEQQGAQRAAERCRREIRFRQQQQALVPLVGSGRQAREEPPLDRGERQLAGDQALLGRRRHGGPACRRRTGDRRREGRHGGLLEQLARRDAEALARRPRADVQAEDRIAAEIEEVVLDAHLADAQHLGPDAAEPLLDEVARRHGPALAVVLRPGIGEVSGGHLAGGVERQGGQRHERRRQHEVG